MSSTPKPSVDPDREARRLSRRGFAVWGTAVAAATAAWFATPTRDAAGRLSGTLRRSLWWNERLARAGFRRSSRSPEFPRSAARMPITNGMVGLMNPIDLDAWRLRVVGAGGDAAARVFTLDAIRALPAVERVVELICVEGWSVPVHWSGVRLIDLAARTGLAARDGRPFDPDDPPPASALFDYVALSTPDRQYYVGLDAASALHPQTLLGLGMDGKPLALVNGAPLRAVVPVKYGFKSLKRLGRIEFTDRRPADFWCEKGYDWYAGL